MVKNLPAMQETGFSPWVGKIPLEKDMATHSSIPVWRISWTEETGRLQPMVSQRVGHDWIDLACTQTSQLQLFMGMTWEREFLQPEGTCPWLPGVYKNSRGIWGNEIGAWWCRLQRSWLTQDHPCNSEDAGSIPDQGTKIPHAAESLKNYWAPQLLGWTLWSPRASTRESLGLSEVPCTAAKTGLS